MKYTVPHSAKGLFLWRQRWEPQIYSLEHQVFCLYLNFFYHDTLFKILLFILFITNVFPWHSSWFNFIPRCVYFLASWKGVSPKCIVINTLHIKAVYDSKLWLNLESKLSIINNIYFHIAQAGLKFSILPPQLLGPGFPDMFRCIFPPCLILKF